MAENPLLPNAELRALRSWTKRAHAVESKEGRKRMKTSAAAAGREALMAATLVQLRSADGLVPEPGDTTALALVSPEQAKAAQSVTTLHAPAPDAHLLLAAGLAAACKRSGTDNLVLAFSEAGLQNSTWTEALTWAQTEDLPLIVAIADPSGLDAFRPSPANPATLTWTSLTKLARKLHLPILSVDGEDAVAVYRVMQESVLRARSGAGPAVLWAMLPTPEALTKDRPIAASPLRRLERYLKTRKISF